MAFVKVFVNILSIHLPSSGEDLREKDSNSVAPSRLPEALTHPFSVVSSFCDFRPVSKRETQWGLEEGHSLGLMS